MSEFLNYKHCIGNVAICQNNFLGNRYLKETENFEMS